MSRKLGILAAAMALFTGLTLAVAADEGPLHKLMEQVNKNTGALRKTVRNPAEFKKGVANIPKHADELIKLAKEAREIKDAADKEKKPLADWQKLMDDMIKETEEFKTVATKANATQAQAKDAFANLNKTCTACHNVFKKED
jgi:cytochrome c556